MKNTLFLLFFALVLGSCREIGPDIDFVNDILITTDTTFMAGVPTPSPRGVLLEEFTGVRCSNCPAAHDKVAQLKTIFGDKLIPISLHTGFYAVPYPTSKQDYKTTFAEGIEQIFGNSGYPNGLVNRQLFSGESSEILPVNKWESYVNNELNSPTSVNIQLKKEYAPTTKTLTLNANVALVQNLPQPIALSIMIVENQLKDTQLKPTGIDTSYIHQHILRTMLTPFNGTKLQATDYNAGRTFIKNLQITLPNNLKPENCEIIAFVHYIGSNKNVLQAIKTKIM